MSQVTHRPTTGDPLVLSRKTMDRLRRQQQFAHAHRARFNQLSSREQEILTLVAEGHRTRDIAEILHLSAHTVRTHRQNIRRQLDIQGVAQAVWWGQAFGLV